MKLRLFWYSAGAQVAVGRFGGVQETRVPAEAVAGAAQLGPGRHRRRHRQLRGQQGQKNVSRGRQGRPSRLLPLLSGCSFD